MQPERLIDLKELSARTTLKKTELYARIKTGEFRPVKIGKRTAFSEAEVSDWIAQRLAARG